MWICSMTKGAACFECAVQITCAAALQLSFPVQTGRPTAPALQLICICKNPTTKHTSFRGINTGTLLLRLILIMSQVQQVRSQSKEETAGEWQRRQAERSGPAGPQYKTCKGRGSGTDLYRTSEHSAPLCKCSPNVCAYQPVEPAPTSILTNCMSSARENSHHGRTSNQNFTSISQILHPLTLGLTYHVFSDVNGSPQCATT